MFTRNVSFRKDWGSHHAHTMHTPRIPWIGMWHVPPMAHVARMEEIGGSTHRHGGINWHQPETMTTMTTMTWLKNVKNIPVFLQIVNGCRSMVFNILLYLWRGNRPDPPEIGGQFEPLLDQGAAVMSHDVVGESSAHPILTYLVKMESESLASRCFKGNNWKTPTWFFPTYLGVLQLFFLSQMGGSKKHLKPAEGS